MVILTITGAGAIAWVEAAHEGIAGHIAAAHKRLLHASLSKAASGDVMMCSHVCLSKAAYTHTHTADPWNHKAHAQCRVKQCAIRKTYRIAKFDDIAVGKTPVSEL